MQWTVDAQIIAMALYKQRGQARASNVILKYKQRVRRRFNHYVSKSTKGLLIRNDNLIERNVLFAVFITESR